MILLKWNYFQIPIVFKKTSTEDQNKVAKFVIFLTEKHFSVKAWKVWLIKGHDNVFSSDPILSVSQWLSKNVEDIFAVLDW